MLPAFHGLARVHVMLEEYEASLPEYDAVLAAVPDQQDCLLGKARALSQLGRYGAALPLLDRLITLGTWLVGDAHYWRGWDRLQLGDVDGASADAELALQLMVNARVHVLAGAVASRRSDWSRARHEFAAALPLDETDCDIPMSLGSIRSQQRDWPAAFDAFVRAAECLVGSQARLARRVEEISTAPMSQERRERFLARARTAVAAAHRQEGQSRYNAAVSLANQGRLADARPWAEQAAAWPEWRERANALLRDRNQKP
jgi:tetratricopeptide (TPR) repeat protein